MDRRNVWISYFLFILGKVEVFKYSLRFAVSPLEGLGQKDAVYIIMMCICKESFSLACYSMLVQSKYG